MREQSSTLRKAEVVAVRFFSGIKKVLSNKRYCYYTDEPINAGDHLRVNVCGVEKTVVAVATARDHLRSEEPLSDPSRATKWILRRSTKDEINEEYI